MFTVKIYLGYESCSAISVNIVQLGRQMYHRVTIILTEVLSDTICLQPIKNALASLYVTASCMFCTTATSKSISGFHAEEAQVIVEFVAAIDTKKNLQRI